MHRKENQLRKKERLSKVYDDEPVQCKMRSIPVCSGVIHCPFLTPERPINRATRRHRISEAKLGQRVQLGAKISRHRGHAQKLFDKNKNT